MNNEPVAWRNLCVSNIGEDSEWIYNEIGQGEPLYTHSVKELTDEEIIKLVNRHIDYVPDEDNGMKVIGVMDFARAILKKAQE